MLRSSQPFCGVQRMRNQPFGSSSKLRLLLHSLLLRMRSGEQGIIITGNGGILVHLDAQHHVGLVVDVRHDVDQPLERPDVLGDAVLGSVEFLQAHVGLHLLDGVFTVLEILHDTEVWRLVERFTIKLINLIVDSGGV